MKLKALEKNTVLVAIMKDRRDWDILHDEGWYRIPIDKAPPIIEEGRAKYLAFYHTAEFKDLKWQVRKYGKVKRVIEVSRRKLFPNESGDSPKANKCYLKIELEEILELPQPILSRRGHRLVFVPTTETKFFQARNFNSLFNTSPLEEKLFKKLLQSKIPAERQWWEEMENGQQYCLDFAIFCKDRPINVECDGDTYHDSPRQVHYDKERNNNLASEGWSVVRYTTEMIVEDMDYVMENLTRTIEQNGGF